MFLSSRGSLATFAGRPRRSEPVEERLVRGTRRQLFKTDCRAAARLAMTRSWRLKRTRSWRLAMFLSSRGSPATFTGRPRRSEPVEERLVRGTRRQHFNTDCRAAARLKRTRSWRLKRKRSWRLKRTTAAPNRPWLPAQKQDRHCAGPSHSL